MNSDYINYNYTPGENRNLNYKDTPDINGYADFNVTPNGNFNPDFKETPRENINANYEETSNENRIGDNFVPREKILNNLYKNISLIFFVFDIILLILLFIVLEMVGKFKELSDEKLPKDIYFTGLKAFDFQNNSALIKYKPGMPNLGNTSSIKVVCYAGYCKKKYNNYNLDISKYNFFTSKIKNNINNDIYINKKEIKSFYSETALDAACSEDCAKNRKRTCNTCSKEIYLSQEGECTSSWDYSNNKFCLAKYLILKWKGFLFSSEKTSDNKFYSYSSNAFLPNESCPRNTQPCGILDEQGNHLCLPEYDKCPINHIVISDQMPTDGYYYEKTSINNINVYYTNENVDNGRIVESLFVDSDYFPQYKNGCQIIDIGKIEDITKHNFDIYTSSNINPSTKTYLKWCDVGHDKFINLNLIKKGINDSKIYQDLNENVFDKIKSKSTAFAIIGIFSLFFFCLTLINIIEPYFKKKEFRQITCKNTISGILIFTFFEIIVSILSSLYDTSLEDLRDKVKENKEYIDYNDFKILIILNKAFYILSFLYIAIIIVCSIYYTFKYYKLK